MRGVPLKQRTLWFCSALVVSSAALAANRMQERDRSPVQRPRTPDQNQGALGDHGPGGPPVPAKYPDEFRTIDGSGNNLANPHWGAADTPFVREVPAAYADGTSAPSGADRPNVREISQTVCVEDALVPNPKGASDYLWMWGQFLDHDITETPVADPEEPFDITVPVGDPFFDPGALGLATIPLDRSSWELEHGQREQVNEITAYVDASNVYGSSTERALALRTLDGTGRLKTSDGDLLPFNVDGLPNAPDDDPSLFLAGDVRANEQAALIAMHTLFVREHNHWAEMIGASADLSGDTIYEMARAIVGAEMQAITYREFLPVLLGPDPLPPYEGYRPQVNAGITNVFAAAAFRLGHTMLPEELVLAGAGAPSPLPLARAFFRPDLIGSLGIDPLLRGLTLQHARQIDPYVNDAVRNFLFGPPGSGGFDLASLNMQRGRDHGLPDYDSVRQHLGLPSAVSFADMTGDPVVLERLAAVYDHPGQVDPWLGMLSEDHAAGALVGQTLRRALRQQFRRLRDGDRFWYTAYLPEEMIAMVEKQTLAEILRRNTGLGDEIPDDVFQVVPGPGPTGSPRDQDTVGG